LIDERDARNGARPEVELLLKATSSLIAQDTRKDSRDALQLPHLQSHRWKMKRMLHGGISEKGRQEGLALDGLRWSGVHASDFNPGSVTFVGGLEPRIWWMGSHRTCSLWGSWLPMVSYANPMSKIYPFGILLSLIVDGNEGVDFSFDNYKFE